jgi:osmotically-inducible protein OsmY
MKTIKFAAVVSGLVVMLAASSVMAQTSGAMAAPAAASAPTSAKAMRVANRQLAKKVRTALTKSKPALPMEYITVLAKDGVISLAGSVYSQDQGTQATTIAQGVPGVTSVNNKLSIKQPGN